MLVSSLLLADRLEAFPPLFLLAMPHGWPICCNFNENKIHQVSLPNILEVDTVLGEDCLLLPLHPLHLVVTDHRQHRRSGPRSYVTRSHSQSLKGA